MKPFFIAMIVARGLDVASSLHGFSQGYTEANPLLSTKPTIFVGEMVGVTVAQQLALERLSHAHPKVARALAMVDVGVSVKCVVDWRRIR